MHAWNACVRKYREFESHPLRHYIPFGSRQLLIFSHEGLRQEPDCSFHSSTLEGGCAGNIKISNFLSNDCCGKYYMSKIRSEIVNVIKSEKTRSAAYWVKSKKSFLKINRFARVIIQRLALMHEFVFKGLGALSKNHRYKFIMMIKSHHPYLCCNLQKVEYHRIWLEPYS